MKYEAVVKTRKEYIQIVSATFKLTDKEIECIVELIDILDIPDSNITGSTMSQLCIRTGQSIQTVKNRLSAIRKKSGIVGKKLHPVLSAFRTIEMSVRYEHTESNS